MRPLHLDTFAFADFYSNIPSYVIASHRWTKGDEASFRDVQDKKNTRSTGYKKLEAFVDYVKKYMPRVKWVWMDTCCINQENAAELSEAVNMMFDWYRNAEVCVAYLADVSDANDQDSFEKSVWFKRGWTLQELLAPSTVIFLDKRWRIIGSKGNAAYEKIEAPVNARLEGRIARITGIPERVLHNYEESQSFGVEERLKWMEGRVTTREEDKYYSLYGIFGVAPGANYGEKRAGARDRLLTAIFNRSGSKEDLTKLVVAKGATHDAYTVDEFGTCLEGTRTELLHDVTHWWSEKGSKPMYWLCGKAGTGKSTISRTVAYNANVDRSLGASFFFKRGEANRAGAKRFFPTIAAQLAHTIPVYDFFVGKALVKDPDICDKTLQEQFEKLVLQPLLAIAPEQKKQEAILIVVDALDECELEQEVRTILRLLARLSSVGFLCFRIFVTSRPELPIKLGFRRLSEDFHQDVVLEYVQESSIADDICKYMTYRLDQIKENDCISQPFDPLPIDWPGKENFQVLMELTVPLFISASTVCRFLAENDPMSRLETILEQRKFTSFSDLKSVYLPILNHSIAGADRHETQQALANFQELVGAIVLLADPLSARSLSRLLKILPRAIGKTLRHLHSVLSIPISNDSPIRPFHLSFRDFLVDSKERPAGPFWIDEVNTHGWLAERCLQRLEEPGTLRMDLCRVGEPGYKRSEIDGSQLSSSLPEDVAYACCYWVWHVTQQRQELHDDCHVDRFLRQHFLHWLEALSWLGRVSEAIAHICKLQSCLEVGKSSVLSTFLDDAKWFVLQHLSVIDLAPLQAYSSAPIFAPTQSIVRSQFSHNIPKWLELSAYGVEVQKPESYPKKINAVAFSPDGQTVASGSMDKTVRLWNASMGKETYKLEGHDDWVIAIAFSPDGQKLASGSMDKTVRLWNVSIGKETYKLRGHNYGILAIAFSPDGQTVASGSYDKTVRLWSTSTGKEMYKLEGHDAFVRAVTFSPDGQTVASGSYDKTVRLWNTSTGKEMYRLQGHDNLIIAIAFSLDGQIVASGSYDKTVRLWNASTGKETYKLEGHDDWVITIAFSPDGQTIASGSHDKTVRLWNALTGEEIHQFQHVGDTYQLAFDAHGDFLTTDTGTLDVRPYFSSSLATRLFPATSRVGLRGQWVQFQDQSLLWLPYQYRGVHSAVHGDTLAIGEESGAVSFFRIKGEELKLGRK